MNALTQTALKYGITCGVVRIISHVAQSYMGLNPLINLNSFFIDLVIFFGFIFFAGKEFKEYKNGGSFHFWQGISVGLIIILCSSVIFSVFEATYYSVSETVFENYLKDATAYLETQREILLERISLEQFEKQKEDLQKTTVFDLVMSGFVKKLIVGFLMTPLIAVLLRNHKH